MSKSGKLTLSLVIVILCFGVYSKNSYSSSKDDFINQIIPLTYKANKLGVLNLSACDFVNLPFLPNIACELIEPVVEQTIEPIVTEYLKEQAIIQDKETIASYLNKKEIDDILELGVKKSTYHFSVEKTYTRNFDVIDYEPKTTVFASFESTIKCGVDLNKGVDITVEDNNKEIIINLPTPTFLSNETTPTERKVEKEGLFAPESPSNIDIEMHQLAKKKAEEYARADNLTKQAKENIKKVLSELLPPLASSQFGYNLTIVFEDEKLKINQENKAH